MKELCKESKERVIDIISKSFDKNASINFVIKQDQRRKKRLRNLVEYSLYQGITYGKVFLSDDWNAACILIRPKIKKNSFSSLIWDIRLIWKVIGVKKIPIVLKREKLLKENHPDRDFFHLWYIGVDPEHQDKGIGSVLLEEILTFCDELPVYLETSVAKNLIWYQRFGFEIMKTIDLGYKLYVLKKE